MNFRFSVLSFARLAMLLLVLWLLLWLGFLTAADLQLHLVWLLLALLPLMAVGYFLWRGYKAGLVWGGFLALGYFAQGVTVTLTSRTDAGYGATEVFLSLLLFSATSMALRVRNRSIYKDRP